jgi:hypothetical protein
VYILFANEQHFIHYCLLIQITGSFIISKDTERGGAWGSVGVKALRY